MKILIDARMYGLENAGIGRYVEQLVSQLIILDKKNTFVILLNQKYFDLLKLPDNWKKVLVKIPHYSLSEQINLPIILYKEKIDLVHFPHFNIPVLYFGKFIVTIHDLIKHTSKGRETTTRGPLLYWLKYLGYKLVFNQAVKRAIKIIVPSNYVKNDLVKEYKLSQEKIEVSYEGIGQEFLKPTSNQSKKTEPLFVYTGSVYPHKNVDRLIEAFKIVNQTKKASLVVVCSRNIFWERLERKIKENNMENIISSLGFVSDQEIRKLYQISQGLVFPTLSEGFGLPGLEAMASQTVVVCSKIPVLEEIYGPAAIYFNPLDVNDIANKIIDCLNLKPEERKMLINKGLKQIRKYSWGKMAKETINIYESSNQ